MPPFVHHRRPVVAAPSCPASPRPGLRQVAVALALVVLASMTAGCGSAPSSGSDLFGSPPTTAPPQGPKVGPIGAAWVTKVEAACTSALTSMTGRGAPPEPSFDATHPSGRALTSLGQFLALSADARKALSGQLLSLGVPPTGQTTWKALQTQLVAFDHDAETQAEDAIKGDAEGFGITARELAGLHHSIATVAGQAGLPASGACASIS